MKIIRDVIKHKISKVVLTDIHDFIVHSLSCQKLSNLSLEGLRFSFQTCQEKLWWILNAVQGLNDESRDNLLWNLLHVSILYGNSHTKLPLVSQLRKKFSFSLLSKRKESIPWKKRKKESIPWTQKRPKLLLKWQSILQSIFSEYIPEIFNFFSSHSTLTRHWFLTIDKAQRADRGAHLYHWFYL